jgi:septin family protein
MIITSYMQKSIQIYLCLLKLSHRQESVTDRRTDGRYYYIPSPLSRGDNKTMKTIQSWKSISQFINYVITIKTKGLL